MVASGRAAVGRSPARAVTLLFGAVFLLVGVAGFIPGVTANFDELRFAGHDSGAELLGLFQVSVLHNVLHLLFGVAGVLMARSEQSARMYLIGGGTAYLLLWVYGLVVVHEQNAANFVPVNDADNWLHVGLALALLGLGLLLPAPTETRAAARR